jgi:phage terminase small subunit
MLSNRQIAFVNDYVVHFNGTRAALRAGFSSGSAAQEAYRLLSNDQVVAAIAERQAEIAAAAGLSAEWVLRQWKQIAEADPNELIWNEVECCRHCYGVNHEYQWVEFEYRKAVESAQSHQCGKNCEQPCTKRIPPLPSGGFGYDPHEPPASTCPVCHGVGQERVRVADTRRVKGAARRLYAGVKTTQHGIEVKMRDQDAALQNIAKYLGMVIDKREIAGPNGGPIPVAHYDAKDLSDDQLAQVIQQQEKEETTE